MSQLRREALSAFKRLHRARQYVFQGDDLALSEARKEINGKFRENKNVEDEQKIKQMIKLALDVEQELRTNVIQAIEEEPGIFAMRITPETTRLDNVPFNPDAVVSKPRKQRHSAKTEQCSDGTTAAETCEKKAVK